MGLFSSILTTVAPTVLGAVLGGNKASNAANQAASINAGARTNANNFLSEQFGLQEDAFNPVISQGNDVSQNVLALLGQLGPEERQEAINNYQNSPGFDFAMQRGVGAIDASASAAGNRNSGKTSKDLTAFGQGLQNQEFNTYLNQLTPFINRGDQARNSLASLRNNFAANSSNNLIGKGEAQASGVINQANAFNSTLGNINNSLQFAAGRGLFG